MSLDELKLIGSEEKKSREEVGDEKDLEYRKYRERYEIAFALNTVRLQRICEKIVADCLARGVHVDKTFPKHGTGTKSANAKFVAAHTQ